MTTSWVRSRACSLVSSRPHVRFRGGRAEVEPFGDLGVRPAPGDQREHLALAGGQHVQRGRRRPVAVRAADELADELAGHARGEQRVARRHDPDPGQQVAGRGVLEQEPAGARPERSVDVFVQVEGGQDEHPDVLGLLGPADYPGRFQPVQMRHPDVHQDDVGPFLPGQRDRLGAVAGLADDLEVRRGINEHPEAAAHERLVVGHQDPDHLGTCAIGKQARTRKPPSGPGAALNSPPNTVTRSRMPVIPWPESARGAGTLAGGAPAPESVTSTATDSGRYLIVTSAAEAAPCLITLVSASWTIRYADRSMPGGMSPRWPSTLIPTSWTWPASEARSARPGAGVRLPRGSPSCRSTPSSRRISVSAERLVASMAASACRASPGWVSITWLPTADCTAMTLIECAMTSCSSRAMRRRSSVTARRASSSRSRSARSVRAVSSAHRARRRRKFRPVSQATRMPSSLST